MVVTFTSCVPPKSALRETEFVGSWMWKLPEMVEIFSLAISTVVFADRVHGFSAGI